LEERQTIDVGWYASRGLGPSGEPLAELKDFKHLALGSTWIISEKCSEKSQELDFIVSIIIILLS
jgi:hypothetical protein